MDPGVSTSRPQWLAFGLVCLAYLGVTVGEQVLSPVLPDVSADLGISEGQSGLAFGMLPLAIAVANLVGGAVLGRTGGRLLMLVGLAATVVGAVCGATANGFATVVVAQVLLGTGAGLYFPAGLQAVPFIAGSSRKGFAMGIYGVAFSGGLTGAALLGALGAAQGWRLAFWAAAGLGAAAFVATLGVRLPPATGAPVSFRFPRRALTGLPTFIGAVGAICQYGAIPFLTTFAVTEWELRAGQAALLLAAGRVISILAKVVGGASSDRVGPVVSARRTGALLTVTGLAWVLLPAGWFVYACAALFAGTVSSLFPVANMVAVDEFGGHGPSLGAYRSAQIGIGALAGWSIGRIGESTSLRTTLAIAVATPVLLVVLLRRNQTPSAEPTVRGSAAPTTG